MTDLSAFLAAGFFLVASHAIGSASAVRGVLIARLTRPGFIALHSGISIVALAAFLWTYGRLPTGPWLFDPIDAGPTVAVWVMPFVLFLVVGRLTTRPPVSEAEATGIYRISRYPGSVGVLLWAYLHLMNMGDLKRTLLFAFLLAIPLAAILRNEVSRRNLARAIEATGDDQGADDDAPSQTRIIPFHAILSGRQKLVWSEIGWWRVALSLAFYAVLLALHPLVIGVDPIG